MTIQEAKQNIGQPFKVIGWKGSKFDTIREVKEDGEIIGDFVDVHCTDCRLKQQQPAQLSRNTLIKDSKNLPGLILVVLIFLLISARVKSNVNQAEVNQLQGIYIFTDSKPLQQYDYLGTVKKTVTFAGGIQYAAVRDRMIRKVKSDYPTADGIIFYGNADRCDAIKFK